MAMKRYSKFLRTEEFEHHYPMKIRVTPGTPLFFGGRLTSRQRLLSMFSKPHRMSNPSHCVTVPTKSIFKVWIHRGRAVFTFRQCPNERGWIQHPELIGNYSKFVIDRIPTAKISKRIPRFNSSKTLTGDNYCWVKYLLSAILSPTRRLSAKCDIVDMFGSVGSH